MRKSQVEPYRCVCCGATILTTDPKLYQKLKEINKKNKKVQKVSFDFRLPKNIVLSENTQLPEEATYAVLFSSEEIIDGTSEKYVGGEDTLVLTSNVLPFDKFINLIPLIVKHHVEELGIDTEKYNVRVPGLHVDLSVNNKPIKLQFGGSYLYSDEFKYATILLNSEMDKFKTEKNNVAGESIL